MRAQKTIVKWKLLGIAIFTISSVHPSKTAAEKHVKRLKKRLGIKATMAPLDPPKIAGTNLTTWMAYDADDDAMKVPAADIEP